MNKIMGRLRTLSTVNWTVDEGRIRIDVECPCGENKAILLERGDLIAMMDMTVEKK